MRFLRRRRAQEPTPSPEAQRRIDAARAAREQSEEGLKEVREQWPEVREVASSLRRHRERNHFAELVSRALGGET
jgi:hypothetical protein